LAVSVEGLSEDAKWLGVLVVVLHAEGEGVVVVEAAVEFGVMEAAADAESDVEHEPFLVLRVSTYLLRPH